MAGTCAALNGCTTPQPPLLRSADLIIRGGTIFDGEAEAGRSADIGVKGDRILFIGNSRSLGYSARNTIDARGLMVVPGFIDPHTHSGDELAAPDPGTRAVPNHVMQGVTTVFIGNDGGGPADVRSVLAPIAQGGAGVNVAAFVGFGAVRRQVLGDDDRPPSDAELATMKTLVASGMCSGALGLSSGLYYAPQSFARTEEVVALAGEASSRGGVYETHLRDEGSGNVGLLPSVDEAIAIGRAARLPVHIAHVKALGTEAQGLAPAIIAKVVAAQREGLAVTADQYPWTASGTRLSSALVPGWALAGGRRSMLERLADSSFRARLQADMGRSLQRRGGAGALLLTSGRHKGQSLLAVAAGWRLEPVDAAIRILREDGDARVASFNMSETDIALLARQNWVVGSSDATDGHPRKFGSFARSWERFVKKPPNLSPGAFARRSSGLTAKIFGIAGRGVLRVGYYADIAVIDPERFAARADYTNPTAPAVGVRTVLVNGVLALDAGKPTGRLGGRALLKPQRPSWSCAT